MALESTALELVEEWKRKCCEFSTQSDDLLIPVIAKVFDAMAVILKKLDNSCIQLALKLLESKRSMCLSAETSEDPSIRTLMYGVIQSVHGILLDMTRSKDLAFTEAESALVIVEEWKRKCCELSIQSEDILISVIAELFDTIALILMGSDHSRIQLALSSLESERSMCLASETTDELSIRALIYGVIQCVHGTLLDVTTLNESIRLHNEAQNDERDYFDQDLYMQFMKEEKMDGIDDRGRYMDLQTENGFSTIPNFTVFPTEPEEEQIDQSRVIPDDNHMYDQFDSIMDEGNIEVTPGFVKSNDIIAPAEVDVFDNLNLIEDKSFIEQTDNHNSMIQSKINDDQNDAIMDALIDNDGEIEETIANEIDESRDVFSLEKDTIEKAGEENIGESIDILKSSSEKIDMETRKRPSRIISNRKNYVESDQDSDEEAGNSMKKMKSNSEQRQGKKSNNRKVSKSKSTVKNYRSVNRNTRRNDTELECPECEFRTVSVVAWNKHLNRLHSTTPTRAGLILRCECGNESYSYNHSRVCKISKITVIRQEDGTTKKP